jgi:hypothetical protein
MVTFPFSAVPQKRDSDQTAPFPGTCPRSPAAQDRCGTVPGYSHPPLSRLEIEFFNQSLWLDPDVLFGALKARSILKH